jgi:hypothetical protein
VVENDVVINNFHPELVGKGISFLGLRGEFFKSFVIFGLQNFLPYRHSFFNSLLKMLEKVIEILGDFFRNDSGLEAKN